MEISRMWILNQVEVLPIVVGALGTVSKRLEGFLEKIEIEIPVEMLQKTVLHSKGYEHEGHITPGL